MNSRAVLYWLGVSTSSALFLYSSRTFATRSLSSSTVGAATAMRYQPSVRIANPPWLESSCSWMSVASAFCRARARGASIRCSAT